MLETVLNSCPVGEQMSQSTSTLKETTCKVRMRLFLAIKPCQWFSIRGMAFYVKRISAGRDAYHEVRSAKVGRFTSWLILQLWYVCHNIGSSVNSLEEGYAMWTYVTSLPYLQAWLRICDQINVWCVINQMCDSFLCPGLCHWQFFCTVPIIFQFSLLDWEFCLHVKDIDY